jgi:hypothetical protein
MVSKASRRWINVQRLNWQKSDGLGEFPVNLNFGYEGALECERKNGPTKHLSGQDNRQESPRNFHAMKGKIFCLAHESASELTQAELEPSSEGDDGESLSEILEGPYSKEMKELEGEMVCHEKRNHCEEMVVTTTAPASQLKCYDDERIPSDWISDMLVNEGQASDSHLGNATALRINHPSLKKRLKRFLVVQRATMSTKQRRDILEAGTIRLKKGGEAPGGEIHKYGDASVVIHCETRDAISEAVLEADPTISSIQRKSKFKGWKDTIKRNFRIVKSPAPLTQFKSLSDTESASSDDEVRLLKVLSLF